MNVCGDVSPPLPPWATLITCSAVCRLIVPIVRLIRPPHARVAKKDLSALSFSSSEKSSIVPPHPASLPNTSLSSLYHPGFSFYLSVFCGFYNHSNNRLIWKTLNYRTPSHLVAHTHMHAYTHMHIKELLYKGDIKIGEATFSSHLLFKETND